MVAMFRKMIKSWKDRRSTTSFTVIVPDWKDRPWHPSRNADSATFRVVRTFPAGTDLFTAPAEDGGAERVSLGPTRWPVLVLHLAPDVLSVVNVSADVLAHVRFGHCGRHVVPALLEAEVNTGLKFGSNARRAAVTVSQ